jgi:hypothetical protein
MRLVAVACALAISAFALISAGHAITNGVSQAFGSESEGCGCGTGVQIWKPGVAYQKGAKVEHPAGSETCWVATGPSAGQTPEPPEKEGEFTLPWTMTPC